MNIREYYNASINSNDLTIKVINGAIYMIAGGKLSLTSDIDAKYYNIAIKYYESARRYLLLGYFFSKVKFTTSGVNKNSVNKLGDIISELFKISKQEIICRADGYSVEIRVRGTGFRFTRGDEKDSVLAFYDGFVAPLLATFGVSNGLDAPTLRKIMHLASTNIQVLNEMNNINYK